MRTKRLSLLRMIQGVVSKRGWFLLGLLICLAINAMPTPQGLSLQGQQVLGLLVMAIVFFVTEAVPFGATALIIVIYQVLLGIRSSDEVPKTFMHDAVFFIMGALMIAAALVKYHIHTRFAVAIMNWVGCGVTRLVFGLVTIAALCAAFISEYAVSAMLLPIGVGLVSLNGGKARCPQLAKVLMLAIGYGCMVGSIATPSGGTRNVILLGYLQQFAGITLGYGQWMVYAFPLALLLIPVVALVLLWVFRPELKVVQTMEKDPAWRKLHTSGLSGSQMMVIGIFLMALLTWISLGKALGLGQVALLFAVVYLVTGLVDWDDYAKINWQVILFYAGVLSLGQCLKDTGLAVWLAQWFSAFVGEVFGITSGLPLIVSTSLVTMGLANAMAAGPTMAVLGPMVLQVGHLGGVSPLVIGLAAAFSTSFAFLAVSGAPASMIVYGSGFLEPKDFLKAGALLSVAAMLLMLFVMVAGYWRLLGL